MIFVRREERSQSELNCLGGRFIGAARLGTTASNQQPF